MKELEGLKALSWKTPYGDLMLEDKIETRKWRTSVRGPVLICCSLKGFSFQEVMEISGPRQTDRIVEITPFKHGHFWNSNRSGGGVSNGLAIAVGQLVDCREMTKEDSGKCFVKYKPPWTEKRINKKTGKSYLVEKRLWCHVYENVRAIEPIPVTGKQRWWDVPRNITDQIRYK